MATVTHAGTATWSTTAGTTTTPTNGPFTPAVGDLLVVIAPSTGVATSTVTDNNADGLGTYSKVGSTFTGFSTSGNLTVWVRDRPIGSATSTTVTAPQNGSTGGGLDVFRVSGMLRFGRSAVRQVAGQSTGTSGTTPAPAFAKACLTGNPVIGAVANGTSPATMTPRSSPAYTEATDLGYATPTTGLETMFVSSGETASTITWGSTSGSAFASVAVELDTGPAGRGKVTVYQGARGEGDPRSQARIGRAYISRNPKKPPQAGSATREGRYGRSIPAKAFLFRRKVVSGTLPASASGSITLSGTAAVSAAASASGSITLTGTATALGRVYRRIIYRAAERASTMLRRGGKAIITRGRRPIIPAAAAGSITLTGTSAVSGAASAAGSITLTGAATARGRVYRRIIYDPVEQATARYRRLTHPFVGRSRRVTAGTSASGSLTLTGTAAASAQAAASGSITFSGQAQAIGRKPLRVIYRPVHRGVERFRRLTPRSVTRAPLPPPPPPLPAGASDRSGRLGRSIPIRAKITRNRPPVGFAAFGSITFSGSGGTPTAPVSASGSITLTGTATAGAKPRKPRPVVALQAAQTALRVRRATPLPAAIIRGEGAAPAARKAKPVLVGLQAVRTARVARRALRPFLARNRRVSSGTSAQGSITLTGAATAAGQAAAQGSITLTGSAAGIIRQRPRVYVITHAQRAAKLFRRLVKPSLTRNRRAAIIPASATGSITLTGQATAFSGNGALGSLTLTGTVGAPTAGTGAAGSLTLTGTGATPTVGFAAQGSLTLAGTVIAATARVAATGFITLGGQVFLIRRDINVTAVLEGPRFTSTLESARFASMLEGGRFTSALEE